MRIKTSIRLLIASIIVVSCGQQSVFAKRPFKEKVADFANDLNALYNRCKPIVDCIEVDDTSGFVRATVDEHDRIIFVDALEHFDQKYKSSKYIAYLIAAYNWNFIGINQLIFFADDEDEFVHLLARAGLREYTTNPDTDPSLSPMWNIQTACRDMIAQSCSRQATRWVYQNSGIVCCGMMLAVCLAGVESIYCS